MAKFLLKMLNFVTNIIDSIYKKGIVLFSIIFVSYEMCLQVLKPVKSFLNNKYAIKFYGILSYHIFHSDYCLRIWSINKLSAPFQGRLIVEQFLIWKIKNVEYYGEINTVNVKFLHCIINEIVFS